MEKKEKEGSLEERRRKSSGEALRLEKLRELGLEEEEEEVVWGRIGGAQACWRKSRSCMGLKTLDHRNTIVLGGALSCQPSVIFFFAWDWRHSFVLVTRPMLTLNHIWHGRDMVEMLCQWA